MVKNRKSVVKLGMECLLSLAVADGVTRHGDVEPYGADGSDDDDDDDDDVDDDDATPGPHIRQDFTHSFSCSLQHQINQHTHRQQQPTKQKKNQKSVTSALRRPPLRQSVNWKRLCLAGLE